MLLDGAKAMRIAFLIALLAFGWIAVYIEFNDALLRRIGDAAHASAFLSLFVGLTALISAFYFRRLAQIRAGLTQGAAIGRWRVSRADWDAFARIDEPETEAGQRGTLLIIVFFAIVIPALMALFMGDVEIFAGISLGIMAIGCLGYALGRSAAKTHMRYRDGIVAISEQGALVNGVAHGWALPGSRLTGVEFDAAAKPAVLSIAYSYWTRTGPQTVTFRAPVPADASAEAKKTAAHLEALSKRAG
jgi:hypothetical protein